MVINWIKAFRLRTLPLSLSCIITGNFLAFSLDTFSWNILALSLLTTLFLQILSNLANDLGDSLKGTDNDNRIGPKRSVHTGSISRSSMKKAIQLFVLLSLLTGIILLIVSFGNSYILELILFFILGVLSIVAAIKYTMGKNPYGYKALGDLFVFIFFGIVGVLGSYFLQTKSINFLVAFPALAIGALSVSVLNMNNLRDLHQDKLSHKRTFAVILGVNGTKKYQIFLISTAIISMIAFSYFKFNSWEHFLYLITLLPLFSNINRTLHFKQHQELDSELKKIALSTFVLSLGLSLTIFLVT